MSWTMVSCRSVLLPGKFGCVRTPCSKIVCWFVGPFCIDETNQNRANRGRYWGGHFRAWKCNLLFIWQPFNGLFSKMLNVQISFHLKVISNFDRGQLSTHCQAGGLPGPVLSPRIYRGQVP